MRQADIEVVAGDLCDDRSLDEATKGIDIVYHIAAAYRIEFADQRKFWEVNAEGTRRLLDASVRAGVRRFVHCSTVGVHGEIAHPPANETAPFAPGDAYQESKVEGERIAQQYMREGRIPLTIFRPTGIYGPGDTRFLKLFRAIKKKRFVMLGGGDVLYHLTYIDDLLDGIILCGTVDQAVGNVYILAGESYVSLKELVAIISDAVGVARPGLQLPLFAAYVAAYACESIYKPFGIPPPLYRRRLDFFAKTRAFDISRAKQELGYQPRVDLVTGVRRTARWYEECGYL